MRTILFNLTAICLIILFTFAAVCVIGCQPQNHVHFHGEVNKNGKSLCCKCGEKCSCCEGCCKCKEPKEGK